jgi:carbonic anhydrase/acetyltransferase-like protein (isoleucine patch superfamily)
MSEGLVKIGMGCFIGSRCVLNTSDSIIVGDDVGIGSEVMIWTHGAYLDTTMGFPAKFAPVRIGSHVWLPSRSICLPGVTIGDNVVIGINSLVNKDVPSGCFAAGIPIRVLQENVYPKPLSPSELYELAIDIVDRYMKLIEFKDLPINIMRYDKDTECMTIQHSDGQETHFFVREKRIEGVMNDEAEDLRDFLRRNGIKIYTGRRFKSIMPSAYER